MKRDELISGIVAILNVNYSENNDELAKRILAYVECKSQPKVTDKMIYDASWLMDRDGFLSGSIAAKNQRIGFIKGATAMRDNKIPHKS